MEFRVVKGTVVGGRYYINGKIKIAYNFAENIFRVSPCEEEGGIMVTNLRETFYSRRKVRNAYELEWEKVNYFDFAHDGTNVAPIIDKLLEKGEDEVVKGIADHLIEMLESKYAKVKIERYGTEWYNKCPMEDFATHEELIKYKNENFGELNFASYRK